MPAYLWLILGLLFLTGEMIVPGGLVLLFFGLAALLVGMVDLGGMEVPAWAEWLGFSVLSVASLLLLRGPLQRRVEGADRRQEEGELDTLAGEVAILAEPLLPGQVGRAELRGTSWQVRSASRESLAAGERCRVVRVEGLMLFVVAEGEVPPAAPSR